MVETMVYSRRFTPTRVGKTLTRPKDRPAYPVTPTRVGKTPLRPFWAAARAVHPHACGEDIAMSKQTRHATGSPPRVWGRRSGLP